MNAVPYPHVANGTGGGRARDPSMHCCGAALCKGPPANSSSTGVLACTRAGTKRQLCFKSEHQLATAIKPSRGLQHTAFYVGGCRTHSLQAAGSGRTHTFSTPLCVQWAHTINGRHLHVEVPMVEVTQSCLRDCADDVLLCVCLCLCFSCCCCISAVGSGTRLRAAAR